jgi:threonylcarbamoyladenosine tRNA methylthiotransferase MtaB
VKYSVITFGCRVNQADSFGFEEALRASGGVSVGPEEADLVVVNTCSVTAQADQGARQAIRRVGRQNPTARVVVTGCYATRRPDEVERLPNVLRVLPNDDKPRLVQLIRDGGLHAGICPSTAERFGDGAGSCGATVEPGIAGRTAFPLRVQTGCAEACSYCVIPSTRGRPRSSPLEAVLAEVDRVLASGFKEISLTGVHLGSYGRDRAPASSLAELLRALASHPIHAGAEGLASGHDVRFRLSSLEPMDCTPAVVDVVASSPRFAPHLHLPLQHASDRMLAGMRRPYTADAYAALVDTIHDRMPDAFIGTDLIVGFPGETDEDFERLADYLEGSPLAQVHVFPYSDRPGTPAAALGEKVPGVVIRERVRRVRGISEHLLDRFRLAQLGTTHQALTLADGSLAVTGNYLKVRIPPGRRRNEWVHVKVTAAGPAMCGEVVGP